jgi:hypothetical protein
MMRNLIYIHLSSRMLMKLSFFLFSFRLTSDNSLLKNIKCHFNLKTYYLILWKQASDQNHLFEIVTKNI